MAAPCAFLPAHAGEGRASHETKMDSLKAEFAPARNLLRTDSSSTVDPWKIERADYLLSRSEVPALAQ